MLTCQAKEILTSLKTLTNDTDKRFYFADSHSFGVVDEKTSYDFSTYSDEINSIMELLKSENLIVNESYDIYHLTQYAIHYRQYQLKTIASYIANKWIDFFALATAIIALIVSLSK